MLENSLELKVFLIRREPAPMLSSFKLQDTVITNEYRNPFSRLQEKEHSEKSGTLAFCLLPINVEPVQDHGFCIH